MKKEDPLENVRTEKFKQLLDQRIEKLSILKERLEKVIKQKQKEDDRIIWLENPTKKAIQNALDAKTSTVVAIKVNPKKLPDLKDITVPKSKELRGWFKLEG